VLTGKEVVKMGLAKAFERIADEIAGLGLIFGGMILMYRGMSDEGRYLVSLGALYLFGQRVRKKLTPSGGLPQGGLPYGQ